MGKVGTLLNSDQLAPALLMATEWHDDPSIPAEERAELLELLDRLAATVIYSRDSWLEQAYTVQPGDTLMSIGDRYQVPWQLLGKINGIVEPNRIPPGTKLKVLRGPFEANVNLRTNEVTVLLRGHYAGRFPCAEGRDSPTTAGEYSIKEKHANPVYYGPTIVDADDPNNPLGERQLVLGNKISLHGTTSPQGLNPSETRGSIRLSNADVDDLFDILSVGSRVVIRR